MTEANEAADTELAELRAEVASLREQVGPVVELVEQSKANVAQAASLKRERSKMFRALVRRTQSVLSSLGANHVDIPSALDADDPAAFAPYFNGVLTELEVAATQLGNVIAEECRELLHLAGTRIFSNLFRIVPDLKHRRVLRPEKKLKKNASEEERAAALELARKVRDAAAALLEEYT